MHVAIMFYNIGGYHAARLRAAQNILGQNGGKLTAIQTVDNGEEHPWGNLEEEMSFPLITLLSKQQGDHKDYSPYTLDAVPAVRATLNSLQPDVVAIAGWGFPDSRAALSWCRHHKVPTIVMSESKFDDEKRYWWRELFKSFFLIKKFSAALVGGKAHKDYLIKLGFPENHIFLGYDAVDNDYFLQGADQARKNPVAVRETQIPKKPYFIAVTRLIKRKNIERLVKAYAVYRDKVGVDQAWELVICGSGVEAPAIKALINDKNIMNCVHLPGFISYKEIINWYGLANAFIHPALQEQWGLVVNEACAAGLPILGSRTVGACAELVRDGENGFLFEPSRLDDISDSLIKVHNLSEESRKKMGEASRKRVAVCSPEQFANGFFNAVTVALKKI